METLFNSVGKKIYQHNGHSGYIVDWKDIYKQCKKWSRNREACMTRVDEIYEYYVNGGYMPCILHLAESDREGLVCYDGNHRREVFNRCINKNVPIKICIIDIIFNATNVDIYTAFENINKCVDVPTLYVDNNEESQVKVDIIELVKEYEIKYKPLLSASHRCHAPNFNRDTFVENIYDIYKSFDSRVTIATIKVLLEKLNLEYQNETSKLHKNQLNYKAQVIEKCNRNNMWLFIDKKIPIEHVKIIYKSYCQ